MECSLSALMVVVWQLVGMILISVTGARYLIYHEGTATALADCPTCYSDDNTSCLSKAFASSSQCVSFTDQMGFSSFAVIEETTPRGVEGDYPKRGWFDGVRFTSYSPPTGLVVSLVLWVGLLFADAFTVFYFKRHRGWNPGDRFMIYGIAFLCIAIYILALVICISVSSAYVVQWGETTCISYTYCNKHDQKVSCVVVNGGRGIASMTTSTRQPNLLPARCWTNGTTYTFYAPWDITIYATYALIVGLIINGATIATFAYGAHLDYSNALAPENGSNKSGGNHSEGGESAKDITIVGAKDIPIVVAPAPTPAASTTMLLRVNPTSTELTSIAVSPLSFNSPISIQPIHTTTAATANSSAPSIPNALDE